MTPLGSGNIRYSGQSGPLFKLVFSTGLMTVLTLGIYRFWSKTRIRKYIWSSTSVDGDAFEYTGTGLEKLLGFLIAIVFLAVYLAVVQLVLTFFGLGVQLEPESQAEVIAQLISIYLSFFSVVPFLLFAVYRARRYKLARTRLRGLRFGMDNAAWGYALRAIGYWLVTILSLGLLMPFATFGKEKYMTDRSHYGDARFEQGGSWQALYPAMKHLFIGFGLMLLGGMLTAVMQAPALLVVTGLGYIWLMIGFVSYQVRSFAYLTNTKTLGGAVTFTADPSTGEVIKRFIIGGLILSLAGAVGFGVVAGIGAFLFSGGMMMIGLAQMVVLAILYMFVLVGLGALGLVLITQPIIAHITGTMQVRNVDALNAIRQRASDKGADAEGFADALDLGGAI